jgi:hypothetical protein
LLHSLRAKSHLVIQDRSLDVLGSDRIFPRNAVARSNSDFLPERSQFPPQRIQRGASDLPSLSENITSQSISEDRRLHRRQQFFQFQSSQPSMVDSNTMHFGPQGAFPSMTAPNRPYSDLLLRSNPNSPNVRIMRGHDRYMPSGRTYSLRSDPGPHSESISSLQSDLAAIDNAQQRLFQSAPDIHLEDYFSHNRFLNRERQQNIFYSQNPNFSSERNIGDDSHQYIPLNREHALFPATGSYHHERISLDRSASMVQQDIMLNRPATSTGEYDPIPLDDMKMPAINKKSQIDPNIEPTKAKRKAFVQPINSASSSESGISSSCMSGRLSKDLMDCLVDDPFEPVPMLQGRQNKNDQTSGKQVSAAAVSKNRRKKK